MALTLPTQLGRYSFVSYMWFAVNILCGTIPTQLAHYAISNIK
jgi:hypothetical protein